MSFKVMYQNQVLELERGLNGKALAVLSGTRPMPLALRVNGYLRPLLWEISDDAVVEPVGADTFAGHWVYFHSLCFLLILAARRAFNKGIVVRHSISEALYCEFDDGSVASPEQVDQLEEEMRRLASAALPLQREMLSLDKVVKILTDQEKEDTARLLELTGNDPVEVYRCGDVIGFFFGPLVSDMGELKHFDLCPFDRGMALRCPSIRGGDTLPDFDPAIELSRIFVEYTDWLRTLGVATMADLHDKINNGAAKELVLLSEALHEAKLASIAQEIADKDHCRMISIAGPSSSGKTTSAHKLKIQLRIAGFDPVNLSLDDYYLDDEHRPVDEQGKPDYEVPEALDLERLQHDLASLVDGKPTAVPCFDFKTKKRGGERTIQLSSKSILIVEGLHGLNDAVVKGVDERQRFGLFVSPLTGVSLDRHNRTSTTDNRLLRRLVRDARTRGYGPEETLLQWPSVTRGAVKYIYPYQKNATRLFNSVHLYELPVLKPFAEPLLRRVSPQSEAYGEACRLLEILRHVPSMPENLVPNNSVLREFIGGSIIDI